MAARFISGMSGTAMTTRPERPPAVRRLHPDMAAPRNGMSTLSANTSRWNAFGRLSNGFGTLAAETGSSMPELSCCSFRLLKPDGGVQVPGFLDFPYPRHAPGQPGRRHQSGGRAPRACHAGLHAERLRAPAAWR